MYNLFFLKIILFLKRNTSISPLKNGMSLQTCFGKEIEDISIFMLFLGDFLYSCIETVFALVIENWFVSISPLSLGGILKQILQKITT